MNFLVPAEIGAHGSQTARKTFLMPQKELPNAVVRSERKFDESEVGGVG